MGVAEEVRRKRIGHRAIDSALKGFQELGYAYGVIGGVGPADVTCPGCGRDAY